MRSVRTVKGDVLRTVVKRGKCITLGLRHMLEILSGGDRRDAEQRFGFLFTRSHTDSFS